ncbi:MAG: AMP-binding protein [Myxococcota bacterium]|nr:AMP-binding protein [Myxococcota bacterium]
MLSPGESSSSPSSVGALLAQAVDRWGARIALRRRREPLRWSVLSWTELGSMVASIAAGLSELGVNAGDCVGVLSSTRVEWTLVDYGVLSIGAVTVPIYHSNTAGQVAHVLRDSGARVVVVEDSVQLDKVLAKWDELPDLEHVVLIEVMDLREVDRGVLLDELVRDGRRALREDANRVKKALAQVSPDSLASIVYSSGTTGLSKGVRLTHRNLLAAVTALDGALEVDAEDTTVLCLPLSHIYGRLGQYSALTHGFCIAYARRVDLLQEVLAEVRPTFFFGVPRLYERIYLQVLSGYRGMPPLLRGFVQRGVQSVKQSMRSEPELPVVDQPGALGRLVGGLKKLDLGQRVADGVNEVVAEKTIFEPVREALGGRMRFCISGGAPLNPDIAEFFRMAGIEILEGYGLTETVGTTTVNPGGDNRIGTVGRPLKGIQVRIAPDGEVLVRGDMVFEGYHNLPEETEAVIDDEGWFHTGDVGEFDEVGYLVITDRKKDLIITSGGKNVAPQRVEATLRLSPYIADAVVFGDRRPYIVALLTLDAEELGRFARELDLPADDWPALLRDPGSCNLLRWKCLEATSAWPTSKGCGLTGS